MNLWEQFSLEVTVRAGMKTGRLVEKKRHENLPISFPILHAKQMSFIHPCRTPGTADGGCAIGKMEAYVKD